MHSQITLTVEQILELACSVGLQVIRPSDNDDLTVEYTIACCPVGGLIDEDNGGTETRHYYEYIGYFTDDPDLGCIPLGPEITKDEFNRIHGLTPDGVLSLDKTVEGREVAMYQRQTDTGWVEVAVEDIPHYQSKGATIRPLFLD